MTLRLAALLALAALVAGCDLAADEGSAPPSTFVATYSGARSGTLGGSVYARSFQYSGLGTRDLYQIQLDATPAGQPPFTGGGVTFQKEGVAPPVGTYSLGGAAGGASGAAAWITVDGGEGGLDRGYYATAGTLRIERIDGDRVQGTFRVTDSFLWSYLPGDTFEPDSVVFEGRFEATLGE